MRKVNDEKTDGAHARFRCFLKFFYFFSAPIDHASPFWNWAPLFADYSFSLFTFLLYSCDHLI